MYTNEEKISVFCHKSARKAVKIHPISNHFSLNSSLFPAVWSETLSYHGMFGRKK